MSPRMSKWERERKEARDKAYEEAEARRKARINAVLEGTGIVEDYRGPYVAFSCETPKPKEQNNGS